MSCPGPPQSAHSSVVLLAFDLLHDALCDERAPEELQPREEDVGDEEDQHERRGLARGIRLELRDRICHREGGEGG